MIRYAVFAAAASAFGSAFAFKLLSPALQACKRRQRWRCEEAELSFPPTLAFETKSEKQCIARTGCKLQQFAPGRTSPQVRRRSARVNPIILPRAHPRRFNSIIKSINYYYYYYYYSTSYEAFSIILYTYIRVLYTVKTF